MLPLKEIGYFHAQCKAQMKKLLYIVLLKLEINGTIEVSHCEQNGELNAQIASFVIFDCIYIQRYESDIY